ncbi:hypothetical protein WICMUC_002029 [Wickerhamomyces mucosus]|uniref:Uncharacterized protein n=1 Tax=Wickerhamomyces mucosus TaxID=1378264 RepID=A0A9P8TEB0_9ASCO|nr:hypothetical protein WICMUC_002029 [Wickerhamomyces mucosus]
MLKQITNSIRKAQVRFSSNKSSASPPKFFSEFYEPSTSTSASKTPSQLSPLTSTSSSSESNSKIASQKPQSSSNEESGSGPFLRIKDLSTILSSVFLAYFAFDNYQRRLELEKKIQEANINYLKNLAIQQNTFNTARKKKDIQTLVERKKIQQREMKMVYHIALLRTQLLQSGVDPVKIDKVIEEFEKNVKMETSISNVSGMALWIVDENPIKNQVPSIHEYDNKK